MATLTISSGMPGFRLVRCIGRVAPDHICGMTRFTKAPRFAGLEAMAQLGALDVRRRIDFQGHAFLLKVIRCRWPSAKWLDGRFALRADLGSQSRRAYVYRTEARGPHGVILSAELMFGCMDYDQRFQQINLDHHYRKMFACLQRVTDAN